MRKKLINKTVKFNHFRKTKLIFFMFKLKFEKGKLVLIACCSFSQNASKKGCFFLLANLLKHLKS